MIQPTGHFRVWRELYSKPIWLNSTLEQQVILMTLMAMANFKPKQWEWQGEKYTVKAGQFITSLESIRAKTGNNVSIQNIRTALKRFEKLEFLTNESTKTGRLITLVNWQDYQYTEEGANIDTNKDLTKSQQRPNKDLTPREEGKKVKKEENKEYSAFVEKMLPLYPGKKVKIVRDKKLPAILKEYGEDRVLECVKSYAQQVKENKTEAKFILNESTFWNTRYVDFIKEEAVAPKKPPLKMVFTGYI